MACIGRRLLGLPLLFSALGLLWNGCVVDRDPAEGPQPTFDGDMAAVSPQPKMLFRDSGDIGTSEGFRLVELPLDLKALRPSQPVEFWEERLAWPSDGLYIFNASEESCAATWDPCAGPLSEIRSEKGEYAGSAFAHDRYRYFVGWNGTRAVVWNDSNATLSFLGRLDNETEALYWAYHQGYQGDSSHIREIQGGFEILWDRVESLCPYKRLRVRLIMRPDGHSEEIARVTAEASDMCIME